MSAIPARRRRRTASALVAGLLGLAALPAGLAFGANELLHESGGKAVDEGPVTRIPVTPTALLAVTDARNEVAAVAMLALDPSGAGGSIVSLPAGANAEIPRSGTVHRIADSYFTGGIDAFQAEVEGLLNVSFDVAAGVGASELAGMLAPFGEVTANLPAPVISTDAQGVAVPVLEAGRLALAPDRVAAGLASSQPGIAESTRLPIVKALWTALASGATAATTTVPTSVTSSSAPGAAPRDVAGFLAALQRGPVRVWQFSANLLTDPVRNPMNADLYEIDAGEIIMVAASVAPSAVSLVSNSIAIMIDSPYDDASLVREAVLRLAYVGANVVVIRTLDAAPASTTVVHFNDPMVRADVENFTSLLGPLEFRETAEVVEGVNARIVLGEDFRTFVGSPVGRVVATTTTTVAG